MLGETFAEMVKLSGGEVTLVADKAEDKIGKPFAGTEIADPADLIKSDQEYDHLLIAHHLRFEEIEREALAMGIPKERIIPPYEV